MEQSVETTAREIERLHRSGRSNDAFALALEAAQRFPRSSISHANLGYFYLLRREPAEAMRAYEAALRANPDNAEARRGLAVAQRQFGIAATGDSISVMPFLGTGKAIDVLVPITLGSGNVVTDELFDDRVFRITKLAVELHPKDADLPAHDLVFNAVGDADGSPEAVAQTETLLAGTRRRVLNDPAIVARTGRSSQAQRLRGIEDLVVPAIERIERNRVGTLTLPVLLRTPGFHAGEHFLRVDDAIERDAALAELPGETLYAIAFVDTRGADGAFVKYRVMAVDGTIYPLHAAISQHWKVHYFSSEMAMQPAFREREERFLSDPKSAIGDRAWSVLQRVVEAVNLDYAGIDFGLDAQGRVVVFETNATMAVRRPPQEPMWRYRARAVDDVLDAVRAMLERYSSI